MKLIWEKENLKNIQKLKNSKFTKHLHLHINNKFSARTIFNIQFFRMYQDKLASLKKQLQQLKDGTHPEYNRKLKRLEAQYKER